MTMDSASAEMESKSQAMKERLAALELERKAEADRRRAEVAANADPKESIKDFLAKQDDLKRKVEASLAQARRDAAAGTPPEALKDALEALKLDLMEFEKVLGASAYFLPKYDARTAAAAVDSFREQITATEAEVVPRKKFGFSKKAGGRSAAAPGAQAEPAAAAAAAPAAAAPDAGAGAAAAAEEGPGLRDRSGGVHVVGSAELAGLSASGYTLQRLTGCDVFLLGSCKALRLVDLADCRVFSGPVAGSVFVENVARCAFHVAARQIRVHATRDTQFYMRVGSRPIIEHSSGVGVAPYSFAFPGSDSLLQDAGLAEETGLWAQVDDFGWHRATASPNWAEVLEAVRQSPPEAPAGASA